MRRYFFEGLALLLVVAGLVFFGLCAITLARRDYLGGSLLLGIGFVVLHVGAEMARLALADRS